MLFTKVILLDKGKVGMQRENKSRKVAHALRWGQTNIGVFTPKW